MNNLKKKDFYVKKSIIFNFNFLWSKTNKWDKKGSIHHFRLSFGSGQHNFMLTYKIILKIKNIGQNKKFKYR